MSTHASPPPQEFVIRSSTGEEAALRRWAFAAAGYVEAAENGQHDSWLAEHFSWLPDASHEDVMSQLVDYLLPEPQFDIICPHCGRLWREYEPGGSAQRSFLPEEDQGMARALRQRLRRVLERFAGGLYRRTRHRPRPADRRIPGRAAGGQPLPPGTQVTGRGPGLYFLTGTGWYQLDIGDIPG